MIAKSVKKILTVTCSISYSNFDFSMRLNLTLTIRVHQRNLRMVSHQAEQCANMLPIRVVLSASNTKSASSLADVNHRVTCPSPSGANESSMLDNPNNDCTPIQFPQEYYILLYQLWKHWTLARIQLTWTFILIGVPYFMSVPIIIHVHLIVVSLSGFS